MQRYVGARGLASNNNMNCCCLGRWWAQAIFRWAAVGAAPIEVVVDGQIDRLDPYLSKSSLEPWDRRAYRRVIRAPVAVED